MAEMSPDTTSVPDRSARSLGRKPMSLQLKIGLLLTLTIVLLGLLAPWIAPHSWDTIAIKSRFLPPNSTYWLGTDEFGRDVLSRVLMGTRLSIAMGERHPGQFGNRHPNWLSSRVFSRTHR